MCPPKSCVPPTLVAMVVRFMNRGVHVSSLWPTSVSGRCLNTSILLRWLVLQSRCRTQWFPCWRPKWNLSVKLPLHMDPLPLEEVLAPSANEFSWSGTPCVSLGEFYPQQWDRLRLLLRLNESSGLQLILVLLPPQTRQSLWIGIIRIWETTANCDGWIWCDGQKG